MRRRLEPFWKAHFPPYDNVVRLARNQHIPLYWIDRMDEAELKPVHDLGLDLILVGGFGIILRPPLLQIPRLGCVNCHSSLLPRHRGPNPFSSVILEGETESGISYHTMVEAIDAGDILCQSRFPIGDRYTALDVYHEACRLAAETVSDLVDEIDQNGLSGVPQDEDEASYFGKLDESQAVIDWRRSAGDIDRLVRAAFPFPRARFSVKGRDYLVNEVLWEHRPVSALPGVVLSRDPFPCIATGDGCVTLTVADFPADLRPGVRLEVSGE